MAKEKSWKMEVTTRDASVDIDDLTEEQAEKIKKALEMLGDLVMEIKVEKVGEVV
jgi:hypothetical protein